MKNILIIMWSLLLGAALAQAAVFEKDVKSRDTKVHISSAKPLTSGSNTLVLKITQNAEPLADSTVSVKAFMPAMPGMPAMESLSDAKALGDGRYEVKLNLSMNGTWQLHIFITPKQGKRSRVKTSLNF